MTRRVAHDRPQAVLAGQLAVERELEAGEAVVVDARVADDLRADVAQGVLPPLLGDEPEPGNRLLAQAVGLPCVRLAGQVHESARAVRELLQDGGRVLAEGPADGERGGLRILHLERVREDRHRPLADRDLDPRAVVDRAAVRRDDDLGAMLSGGQAVERVAAHGLEPACAHEDDAEGEHERADEKPEPAVDDAGAHRPPRART